MGESEEDVSKAEDPGAPIRRDVSRTALSKPQPFTQYLVSRCDVLELAGYGGRGGHGLSDFMKPLYTF